MSKRSIPFSFLVLLAHCVTIFGIGFALLLVLGVDPRTIPDAPPLAFVALAIAGSLDIGLVFAGLLRRFGRISFAELGWSRFRIGDVALGLVGLALLVALVYVQLGLRIGWGAALDHLGQSIADVPLRQRAFCFLIGLVAAFTEETLFRGYMQPAVQARIGRWLGLVIVAVVFAAYHGRFTPEMFLGKLGVGLVLGGLRDRTRTLWSPGIAHVLQWTVLAMA
jgi:membrane protease YdiL (CAAX protease family)